MALAGHRDLDAQPAEFDHFFHRGLNRPEHGWLICKGGHVELTQGGYLACFARVTDFRRFQSLVADARKRGFGTHAEFSARFPQPFPRP